MYYMKPGPDGRTSPMWEHTVPGPPGRREDAAGPALTPIVPDRDMTLDCDVVVVGLGAGGPAAAVLADAGLDVVVLEAGDYVPETELDGSEYNGYASLYLNGGAMASRTGARACWRARRSAAAPRSTTRPPTGPLKRSAPSGRAPAPWAWTATSTSARRTRSSTGSA